MSRGTLCAALFTVAALLSPAAAVAASVPGTSGTVGVRGGSDAAGGFIDVILPVVATEKGIGFINPRFSLEDRGESEVNVGAGWRQLAFGDRVLLGGNIYFDSRSSEHNNRFSQLGAGLEVLSPWLDARANLYLPEDKRELIASKQTEASETSVETTRRSSESLGDPYAAGHQIAQDYTRTTLTTTTTTTTTTRRLFEQFESALQGFDAEIGALLPLPPSFPAVRLFGGYYSFEDAFGKRVEGPKGRLEMRIGTFLVLDGEVFDDDELNGTGYFAGARFRAPFHVSALFAGRNPFAGWNAPVDGRLASRMTEMVMRDPRVQTGESEPAENEDARKVEVAVDEKSSRKSSTETFVLLDNVTFVDDDASGSGDGTAENPYAEIQAGVDGSGANANVYVYAGDYASVTLVPGVTLWGAGTAVAGYGGKQFGGEAYPTIGGASPAVTVASDTRVTGFQIVNTDDSGIYGEVSSGAVTIDNNIIEVTGSSEMANATGILLTTTDAQVTISGNSISCVGGRGSGVALASYGSSSAVLDGNTVLSDGPQRWGIVVSNYGSSLTLAVRDNSITSGNIGLWVANFGSGSLTASADGNWVSAVSSALQFENGTDLGQDAAAATMTVTVRDNTVADGDIGLSIRNVGGTMAAVAADNTATHSAIGIEALLSAGVTDLTISGNTLGSETLGGWGILAYSLNDARTTVSLTGNTVYLDNDAQMGVEVAGRQSTVDVTAGNNTVVAAGTDAIGFSFIGVSADVTLSASGNGVTGDAAADMELLNSGGAFEVNAAAPGTGGDLSGLNDGMNVVYAPDSAAFTFLP